MSTLLVVHHTPSPVTRELLEAVLAGARDPEVTGVDVQVVPALSASVSDVLAADGYLLGTPANFGYMSGALKHFFDTTYYPCLDAVRGRPVGVWVHGGSDTTGAVRAVAAMTTGWALQEVVPALELAGAPDRAAREACTELGGTVAATLSLRA